MLEMRAVAKVFRTEQVETHALRSLDLHVREGEFVAVTGPSGSGKTTFLNIAGLLEPYDSGTYELDGTDVTNFGGLRLTSGQNAFELDNLAINPVPEPGTWAMMLLGFGAVGFAMRRRKQKLTVSYA